MILSEIRFPLFGDHALRRRIRRERLFCSLARQGQEAGTNSLCPVCNVSGLRALPFCFRQEHFMQRFHTAAIAVALLAGTSLALAQQEKTQQNSADEALTRSAPEAKDQPQAPPAAKQNDASQPGLQQNAPAFNEGKLTAPSAPQGTQAEPAKFSLKNAKLD